MTTTNPTSKVSNLVETSDATDSTNQIDGQTADILKTAIPNMFRMFRGAPTYRDDGIFDISEDIEVDEHGKLRSKPE